MPTFGVTPTGFVIRTLENLNALVISAVQSAIGVMPVDALLTLLNIINERFAELWQLGEAVYSAGDVDAATGDAQDKINSITGTIRNAARSSTTVLSWTGNPGVSVNTLTTRAKTSISLQPFAVSGATDVILAVPAWVINHLYHFGDRITANGRVYICVQDGNSAPSGTGPGTTGTFILDGPDDLAWNYVGDGTGVVDIAAASVFTGPITALAGSITVIDTPLAGVLGVTNLLDAVLGADVETSADYRVRREQELAQPGSGTASAIAAALNPTAVVGISNVTVFQNTTDLTNVDGMPPHSIEVLALGGDDATIARLILENADGGIATTGNNGGVVITDDQGFLQTIFFSRPVQKLIYNTLNVTYDPKTFPGDGVTQIKSAIVAVGVASACGIDARPYQIGRIAGAIAGVLDITSNLISAFPVTVPVASANIAIAPRELAVYDSSRMIVNITPGTP